MSIDFTDTITALATPPGIGSISIIRVSGDLTSRIAKTLFPKKKLTPRYTHTCFLIDPQTSSQIDEVCVVLYQSPSSFTGEDSLEIQCHGSEVVVNQILTVLLHQGCRIAKAGEFTKRAFLNGKMDLTKAESIIDLIHAKNDRSHHIALDHLRGSLYQRIQSFRKKLIKDLEHIEGSINFPDEVTGINHTIFRKEITDYLDYINLVLNTQDFGKQIQHGIKILIIGYPNVGKSSFLNTLSGEKRAIVTSQAGTTRDYIELSLNLGGMTFVLQDTAGFRETSDKIEKMGINKINELIKSCNGVCLVTDPTRELNSSEITLIKKLSSIPHKFLVINKSDLTQKKDHKNNPLFSQFETFSVSSKNNSGILKFKESLVKHYMHKEIPSDIFCNVRQIACLKHIHFALTNIVSGLDANVEDDMLSIDIKDCILKLGEITGDEVNEEVLDGIFSRFCVGK